MNTDENKAGQVEITHLSLQSYLHKKLTKNVSIKDVLGRETCAVQVTEMYLPPSRHSREVVSMQLGLYILRWSVRKWILFY